MKNLSASSRKRVCHIILFLFSASTLFAQQPATRTILRTGKLLDVKHRKDICQSVRGDRGRQDRQHSAFIRRETLGS